MAKSEKVDTKENLLRAATDLFYRKGYADTSIREIGSKAGISTSLVYHYFNNKQEMLFEIVNKVAQDLLKTLNEINKNIPDPVECLREMLVAQTAIMSTKLKKESKIMFDEYYWVGGKYKEMLKKTQREVYDIYREKFRVIKKMGLLNEIDLTVLNFSIFGIIFWFFRWYKVGGRLTEKEVADNIWKFVFYGMLKSKPLHK